MKTIALAGQVVNKVLDVCNRRNDSEMTARLYNEIAILYLRLCAMHPFEALRRTKAYASDDEALLPANTCDVRWVIDENDQVYTNRDAGPASTGERTFVLNTITTIPDSTGLPFTSDDCVVTSGENTFTSVALALAISNSKIPESIAVTGTGVVSGTYALQGTMDTKPYYEYESGGTTGRISYDISLGAWIYSESDSGYTELYGVVSDESLPPLSGYLTIPYGEATDIALAYTEESGITAVGEFVIIGDNNELFEVTEESGSTFTLDRTYRGDSEAAATVYVRPPIAQSIVLYDQNGEVEDGVDYTVYYWVIPPALHRSTDVVLLPTSEALELMLLRATPEAKEKRPISQSQIDSSISELKRLNPDKVPSLPKQHIYAPIGSMDTSRVYGGTRR